MHMYKNIYMIYTFILYSKIYKISSFFSQNQWICRLWQYLCQHCYVNQWNWGYDAFIIFNYFTIFRDFFTRNAPNVDFASFLAQSQPQVSAAYLWRIFVQLNNLLFLFSSSFFCYSSQISVVCQGCCHIKPTFLLHRPRCTFRRKTAQLCKSGSRNKWRLPPCRRSASGFCAFYSWVLRPHKQPEPGWSWHRIRFRFLQWSHYPLILLWLLLRILLRAGWILPQQSMLQPCLLYVRAWFLFLPLPSPLSVIS